MRDLRTILVISVLGVLPALTPAARAQDPMPESAVMFFNTPGCPIDWYPYYGAYKRAIVPVQPGDVGLQVPPDHPGLYSHIHKFSSSITLPWLSYALGPWGCTTNCVSAEGTHPIEGETGTGTPPPLPEIFLYACIKAEDPAPGTIPSGLMAYFFRSTGCKRGWTQVTEATGRILVGLPSGGSAGATFGGPPLRSKEDRAHSHRMRGDVTTNVQPVAAASPGAAGGHGLHGTYPYDNFTTESTTLLAYVQLLLCRKN